MSKQTEALKLAEKALVEADRYYDYDDVLAAIREALADQTPYEIGYRLCKEKNGISAIPYEIKCDADFDEAVRGYNDAFYGEPKAVAEPVKQEPVALGYLDVGEGGYLDIGTDLTDDQIRERLSVGKHNLYAAPVDRQWVDLTDEEVTALIREGAADGGWQGFAARVQTAFKRKNK